MNELTKQYIKHVVKKGDLKKFEQVSRLKQFEGQTLKPFKVAITANSRTEAVTCADNMAVELKFFKRIENKNRVGAHKYIFQGGK